MKRQLSLQECADGVIDIMTALSYHPSTIKSYRSVFDDFIKYSNERGKMSYEEALAIEYAGMITGKELKELALPEGYNIKYVVLLRSLRILGEYSRSQTFTPRFKKYFEPFRNSDYWNNIYTSFMNYLLNDCDYADSSVVHKELTVRLVIHIFIQKNIQSLNEVSKGAIECIVSQFIHDAPKSVTHRIGEMKQFFRYCFEHNLSNENLSYHIPALSTPHQSKIPASWSAEEAKQLLDSIDRSSRSGKRDYAILLIACRLGLRAVDLANLELSDFNWEAKTITVRQKKTRNTITLPLLNDIGWAVIDYIKNGRPETEDNRLFIRIKAPFTGMESRAFTNIFVKRMHAAGLKVKRDEKCGIHSLRHTLGSLMLEKETPLTVISQVLGHKSIQSTEVYLHINMAGLNECPIDPEKVFSHEV